MITHLIICIIICLLFKAKYIGKNIATLSFCFVIIIISQNYILGIDLHNIFPQTQQTNHFHHEEIILSGSIKTTSNNSFEIISPKVNTKYIRNQVYISNIDRLFPSESNFTISNLDFHNINIYICSYKSLKSNSWNNYVYISSKLICSYEIQETALGRLSSIVRKGYENIDFTNLEPHRDIFEALVFGVDEEISNVDKEAYITLGISHLIVASGSNVAIFIVVIKTLLAFLRIKSQLLIHTTILIFLLTYLTLLKYDISILRACIFYFVEFIFNSLGKKPLFQYKLLYSIFIIFIIYPNSFYNLSFILSYTFTLIIYLLSLVQKIEVQTFYKFILNTCFFAIFGNLINYFVFNSLNFYFLLINWIFVSIAEIILIFGIIYTLVLTFITIATSSTLFFLTENFAFQISFVLLEQLLSYILQFLLNQFEELIQILYQSNLKDTLVINFEQTNTSSHKLLFFFILYILFCYIIVKFKLWHRSQKLEKLINTN